MKILTRLLITAIVAFLLSKFLPGVHIHNLLTAIIFSIILGVFNLVLKPILQIFSLPLTILTLGLFSLVINTIVVLAADYFVKGMSIRSFGWAFVFSICLSILTSILNKFIKTLNE